MRRVLVVGAGLAGARTCQTLRAAGFTGWLGLVGAEADGPYDRPPLSKDPAAEVDLRASMGIDVWALADEVRLGVVATGLVVDPAGRGATVHLSDARAEPGALGRDTVRAADVVVVATGATAVLPPRWAGPRVHVLHSRADAVRLWSVVGPDTTLVVIGGGWIGCEAAATAAARGARVHLIEAADRVLADRVPPPVSDRIHGWLAEAGVRVRLGHPVEEVVADGRSAKVVTAGGAIETDQVLVGLGVRPATDWLRAGGVPLRADGAVPTDPWGRAEVPGIFAVGDAAARWSQRRGDFIPGGHWTAAMSEPQASAAVIRAWAERPGPADSGPADSGPGWRDAPGGPVPDPVEYVFSDIGSRTIQVLGEVSGTGPVRWHGDDTGWAAWALDEQDRVRGLCAWNRPRSVAAARRAIAADPVGRPPSAGLVST